jgi:hypothetical protein
MRFSTSFYVCNVRVVKKTSAGFNPTEGLWRTDFECFAEADYQNPHDVLSVPLLMPLHT